MKKLNIQLLLILGLLLGLNDWTTTLSAQDNYRVSGTVFTSTGHLMPNVAIALVGDTQTWLDTTGVDGKYSFPDVPKNEDYHLEFKKDGDRFNGITAEDARLLEDFLIGLGGISTYGRLSGDLDGSFYTSTMDIIAILRLVILRSPEPFNHEWQFIYAYANVNEVSPFSPEPILPLRINNYPIFQLNQHMDNIDFVGSKIGDINQSANPFE